MAKQFPKDCTKDCPHYHYWDMSIDDYTNVCDKLDVQVDDCDAYSPFYIPLFCPLDATKESTEKELAESIISLIPHLPTESDKASIQAAMKEGDDKEWQ